MSITENDRKPEENEPTNMGQEGGQFGSQSLWDPELRDADIMVVKHRLTSPTNPHEPKEIEPNFEHGVNRQCGFIHLIKATVSHLSRPP